MMAMSNSLIVGAPAGMTNGDAFLEIVRITETETTRTAEQVTGYTLSYRPESGDIVLLNAAGDILYFEKVKT